MRRPIKCIPSGYITAVEAARRLKVSHQTVCTWLRRKRIEGKFVEIVEKRILIKADSLKDAFKVKCKWWACNKVFTARHPLEAEYCCRKHTILAAKKRQGKLK